MDRRRFAPSPDGLEGRMLLSTARPASAITAAQAPVANLSSTLREKELRIERLPYFLQTLQPGRVLPGATITRGNTSRKLREALESSSRVQARLFLARSEQRSSVSWPRAIRSWLPTTHRAPSSATAATHSFGIGP